MPKIFSASFLMPLGKKKGVSWMIILKAWVFNNVPRSCIFLLSSSQIHCDPWHPLSAEEKRERQWGHAFASPLRYKTDSILILPSLLIFQLSTIYPFIYDFLPELTLSAQKSINRNENDLGFTLRMMATIKWTINFVGFMTILQTGKYF